MHMPEGHLIKHRRTAHCLNNTDMWIIHRDVEVVSLCSDTEFSLNGEEGGDKIEGVVIFKYLGRPLDQSDDEWMAVIWNIRKSRQVWGRLGVILRREGVDPITSAAFYRAVV